MEPLCITAEKPSMNPNTAKGPVERPEGNTPERRNKVKEGIVCTSLAMVTG